MSWLTRQMNGTATYWAPPGSGNAWGYRGSFITPSGMACHWEDRNERYIRKDGTEANSLAIVYLPALVEAGGYLFKGTSSAADPRTVANAFLIERSDEVTEIRGTDKERKAYL